MKSTSVALIAVILALGVSYALGSEYGGDSWEDDSYGAGFGSYGGYNMGYGGGYGSGYGKGYGMEYGKGYGMGYGKGYGNGHGKGSTTIVRTPYYFPVPAPLPPAGGAVAGGIGGDDDGIFGGNGLGLLFLLFPLLFILRNNNISG